MPRRQAMIVNWGVLAMLTLRLLNTSALAAGTATAVTVYVSHSRDAAGVVYRYRLVNESDQRVVMFKLGANYLQQLPELRTPPLGWAPGQSLPASSVGSPRGWTPLVVTLEESDRFFVRWRSDNEGVFDVRPQATLTGFSVHLSAAAPEYSDANFDAILGNGAHAYGVLRPDNQQDGQDH